MPGYEFIRLRFVEPSHYWYAEKLTPSGGGMRVATSREIKSASFLDNFRSSVGITEHGLVASDIKEAMVEFKGSLAREGWRQIPEVLVLARPLREGAPRQEYEYCLIDADFDGNNIRYLGLQLTPDEAVFIDKDESEDALRTRVVSKGWQPIDGEDNLLKRPIGAQARPEEPGTTGTSDPTERLKKLGELRDTGVLTEEEFQVKKKEILAEM